MENIQIGRKVMELNKAVFDNTFNYISTLQSQNEKIALNFLEKLPWFPEDGKKAVFQYFSTYKKSQSDFKSKVDDNYQKVAEYFVPTEKIK